MAKQMADKADAVFWSVLILVMLGAWIGLGVTKPKSSQYCNNVASGAWPDYEKGRYKTDCGGKDPPKFIEKD